MRILSRFDYNYNFMGKRKIAMIGSILMTVITVISLLTQGLMFGLDFTGGSLMEVSYSQAVELQPIRENLHKGGFPEGVVQHFGTARDVSIRLGIHPELKNQEMNEKVMSILQQGGQKVEVRRNEFVGAYVGNELIQDAVLAVLYTMIGILIYVALRFEYRFAMGAVLAALHDPVMILGIFSIFRIEFDLTTVAAILAVIGYSLNDTIVVFDRIRDNFLKLRKKTSVEVMDISINETLSRTIMTSVTTLLVVVVLFFFGGDLIHGFATALIIGIVVGTYSSIYVASALALGLGVSRADLLPVVKEGAEVDKNSKVIDIDQEL
ncbi:MAG: protein translocase subunit SecF [Thiotrichaceae bacterium]|nr:protein translocase subunit SecF [Thiotrichaceae bacterium]